METSNLLQDILGHDNTTRQRAETELNNQRQSNPAGLLTLFITNMRNEKIEVAQIACILFKKYFLENQEGIQPSDLEQMKQAVMDSLDFNTQPLLLLKRKGDIISKVFSIQGKNEELLNLLVNWANAENVISKQFAMYVFEILSECHLQPAQLMKYQKSFFEIFEKSLKDTDIKVRVAALKATTSFMSSVEDKDIVQSFVKQMELILNVVVEALKADESQGKLALESMVDLTKVHPQCWKHCSNQLVTILSDVVQMTDFEEGTRSQAVEVVVTLASQVPATLRKCAPMKDSFFPALIKMLTEVEEDMEAWCESVDGEEGTGNDAHTAALMAIGRLSLDMKEAFMLDCVKNLNEWIGHADWKVRQAGFLTFGVISESCRDYMRTNLDVVMQTACKGLTDAHPRVRYSGLSCLALVLTELSPMAQTKFHKELVPVLLGIIQNEKTLKIQTHAVSCMINFTQGLIQEDENEINDTKKSSEILTMYADQLFSSLHDNLKKAITEKYEPLQEEVMNLLNVAATLIEEHFATYFTKFLPLMIEILDNVEGKTIQQMNLRARTIESIGFMVAAVSENNEFMGAVQQVTEKLFGILQSQFAHDDPQEVAVKEALSKVAFYLKEDFHVVAPKYLEILVADANQQIDIKQESAELPSAQNDQAQKSFEFKLKGMESSTRVSLNTSALGNKIAAFQHILKLSEAMGTGFAKYVPQILPVMKANVNHYSKAIKKAALKTLQYLLIAVGEPNNLAMFKDIYGLIGMNILMANKKGAVKDVKLLFKEMFHCMRVISQNEEHQQFFESEAQMNSFGQLMAQCLQTVNTEKEHQMATLEEKAADGQIDEEDEAEIKQEIYKITGAATYINECADIIMNTYGQECAAMIDGNVKFYFAKIISQYRVVSSRELQDATFFFMEYIEHCNSTDAMMIYELCTQYIELTNWSKPDMADVRQNTIYGIGAMAKHLDRSFFKTLLDGSLKAVEHVLSNPDAHSEDNIAVTENAMITLGRLALKHSQQAVHVNQFLSALPLKGDEEAQEAHQYLFEEVLAGNAVLMGECKAKMLETVVNIQKAVAENDGLLTDEGKEMMQKVMQM